MAKKKKIIPKKNIPENKAITSPNRYLISMPAGLSMFSDVIEAKNSREALLQFISRPDINELFVNPKRSMLLSVCPTY